MDNIDKDLLPLNSSMEDLEEKILKETDLDRLDQVINLFNLNIKKKDIIRTNKLNKLQDLVSNQIETRLTQKAGEFSNKDLLDYFKVLQETINKADNSLSNIDRTPIQITKNELNLNVNNTNQFDRASRERITQAVNAILSQLDSQEVLDITEEVEEEVEPETGRDTISENTR